jgi:hypothetical protein
MAKLKTYFVSISGRLSGNFDLRLAELRPVPPLVIGTRLFKVRLHSKHGYACHGPAAVATERFEMI